MLRFSSNSEEGLLWGRIGYFGAIFAPLTLLHLSYVFPQEKTLSSRNKCTIFGLYIIGTSILYIFNSVISVQEVQLNEWGYQVSISLHSKFYLIIVWLLAISIFGIFNFYNSYIQSKTLIERKQIINVFFGAIIVIVLTFGTNIFPTIVGIRLFPLSTISLSIFAIFIGAAVLKHSLFIYRPMTEITIEPEKIALLNRDELEKEVKARTVALAKANEELKIEVLERKNTEKQIKNALMEKEILLREIHHRVKNNLQIISSLIYLQSKKTKDNEINDAILEIYNRIRSMSLIHETLYQSKNLAEIDFNNYIKKLTNGLFRSYGINTDDIKLKLRVNEVKLVIDTAISCGLIINELVSNSLKHAFPNSRKGEIHISLDSEDKKVILMVSDDGTGLPDNLNIRKTDTLGLQLIRNLVKQLDGKLEFHSNNGAKFKISFTVLKDE